MSGNSQQQPKPQPQQQKLQASGGGGGSKAATLKQLKAAQQLKNLLKASASIDEQPDEEADASKESEIEESVAKKPFPLLNKVKATCQDNYKQQQQQQQINYQHNMSDNQEDLMTKKQRQETLGANEIITRRYSGPAAQVRITPNHQLNTRKSFENSQITNKLQQQLQLQGRQSYDLDNEAAQVEYRASLQPVYEPKHYLANCVPIQFIPLAGSSGQQQISGAFTTRRRSPVSCCCLSRTNFGPNSTTSGSAATTQTSSRRQIGACSNFCCQLQQKLAASQIESSSSQMSRSASPYDSSQYHSTGNEQKQIPAKAPPELLGQSSTVIDNNYDLQKHQQQYYYHQNHQHSPHHHNRQHPCYNPRDLRRYSSCIAASACCAITPNDGTFTGAMALRRRDSTTTRLRRLSVVGQSHNITQQQQQQPTSTSCNHQNNSQVTQEIKVTPTQASSRIKSPSSRRHTLAIVSTW